MSGTRQNERLRVEVRPYLRCGLELLESLRPGSVGLVLSDLPSGETNAPFDRVPDLERFWCAAWSALRPHGNVVVMASSLRFANHLVMSQPKAFRYELVWRKTKKTGFLNAAQRPLRQHEFVLVFWRAGRGTYNPQMLETSVPISSVKGGYASHKGKNYDRYVSARSRAGATDRYPASVLDFSSVPSRSKDRRHHQQKPVELLRYLVQTYSDAGDLVVDPFAGSGSTGVAAIESERQFLGCDINPAFAMPEMTKDP